MITQHRIDDEMKDSMRAPWIADDFGAIAREIGLPEAAGFTVHIRMQIPTPRLRTLAL